MAKGYKSRQDSYKRDAVEQRFAAAMGNKSSLADRYFHLDLDDKAA
jgi:hypothetical protein